MNAVSHNYSQPFWCDSGGIGKLWKGSGIVTSQKSTYEECPTRRFHLEKGGV